MQKFDLHNLNV